MWGPPYIAYPPPFFFKFCPPLSPPTPTPTVFSAVLFLWLNRWSYHVWCAILLNNMDLHMLSLGTLVPEGPWCVFNATRHHIYGGLAHNVVFYWYSDFVIIIQHTQGPVHWHTHINIYLLHLLCAHGSYILTHWYQKFTFNNVISFQKLLTCKSYIVVD